VGTGGTKSRGGPLLDGLRREVNDPLRRCVNDNRGKRWGGSRRKTLQLVTMKKSKTSGWKENA